LHNFLSEFACPKKNRWIGQRIDDPALDLTNFARPQGINPNDPIETVGELPAAVEAVRDVRAKPRHYNLFL